MGKGRKGEAAIALIPILTAIITLRAILAGIDINIPLGVSAILFTVAFGVALKGNPLLVLLVAPVILAVGTVMFAAEATGLITIKPPPVLWAGAIPSAIYVVIIGVMTVGMTKIAMVVLGAWLEAWLKTAVSQTDQELS